MENENENEIPSKEEINKMVEEAKAKMVFQPAIDLYNQLGREETFFESLMPLWLLRMWQKIQKYLSN